MLCIVLVDCFKGVYSNLSVSNILCLLKPIIAVKFALLLVYWNCN